jgi:hypothetical protein
MSAYFPRHTAEWRLDEPAAFRRLTMSLIETAVIAGVAVRLLRSLALTYGGGSFIYLGGTLALVAIILFGLLAAHLSNYTMRTWLWRAPAFAAVECIAEIATSALLIAFRREPIGSRARAEFADLFGIAEKTIGVRFPTILGFAALLAAVVYAVRYMLIKRERSESAAEALRAELDAPTPVDDSPPGRG